MRGLRVPISEEVTLKRNCELWVGGVQGGLDVSGYTQTE